MELGNKINKMNEVTMPRKANTTCFPLESEARHELFDEHV